MASIFVYGTLLLPEVQRRVVGRSYPAQPGVLHGFARGRVRGQSYPSLRPVQGAMAQGDRLTGLSPGDLGRFDGYEGERYGREEVQVELESGQYAKAWVWMLKPAWRGEVSEEPWSLEDFVEHDLEAFLRDYEGLG